MIWLHSLQGSGKVLTIMIFPPLPTVIPEFLNPELTATECCRTNKCFNQVLHTFTRRNNYDGLQCNLLSQHRKKPYSMPSPRECNKLRWHVFKIKPTQIVAAPPRTTITPECVILIHQCRWHTSVSRELHCFSTWRAGNHRDIRAKLL